jgi:hypothetical protein
MNLKIQNVSNGMASYKAIKYLHEPNVEVGIENQDEWNGFLATPLGK